MSKARDLATRGGITQVVPTSIAKGASGSASVSANGKVTFTDTESISLNNVFTSNFKNYKLVFDFKKVTDTDTSYMRWRANGSTNSDSSYYSAGRRSISWFGASSDMFYQPTTYIPISDWLNNTGYYSGSIDIFSPYIADKTKSLGLSGYMSSSGAVGAFYYASQFWGDNIFDGLTLGFNNTASGTIQVYGYNNG